MQLHKAVVRIQSRYRGYIVRKVPPSAFETSPAQTPYRWMSSITAGVAAQKMLLPVLGTRLDRQPH